MVVRVTSYKASDGRMFESFKEAQNHELSLTLTEIFSSCGLDFDSVLTASKAVLDNAGRLAKALSPMAPETPAEPVQAPSEAVDTQRADIPVAPPGKENDMVPGQGRKWGQLPRTVKTISVGDGATLNEDGSMEVPVST